jgi:hypothetical protein
VTLTQSDVNDLLDALRADGDIDVIRKGVEFLLQALIDVEAAEHIGAGRYERTETRTTQRNGTRDRLRLLDVHVLHAHGSAGPTGAGASRHGRARRRRWGRSCREPAPG